MHDWFTHDLPGPYWSALDVSESLKRIAVPALHISGWFDTFLSGSVAGFLGMAEHADNQYLVAGPWVHIPWGELVGEQNLGPEALLDTDSLLLRWFNHWLKDSGEFDNEPRIRHFALGANRWFDAETFPAQRPFLCTCIVEAVPTRAKAMAGSPPRRPLPSSRAMFLSTIRKPRSTLPGGPAALSGPFNQAQLEMGNNLLVYTGAPLVAPLHIFGSPKLTLYCATSAAPCGLHRQAGEGAAQRPGRFCVHWHRPLVVSFSRLRLPRRRRPLLANRARAYFVRLRRGRCNPAGSGQQRLSPVRPQSLHCRAAAGWRIPGTGSARPRCCCMTRSILPGWNCHWRTADGDFNLQPT